MRATTEQLPFPLSELLGLLYDAATDTTRWGNFLEAASKCFAAFSANFVHYDAIYPDRSMAFLTGYGDLPIEQRGGAIRKLTDLRDQDPRLRYSMDHPSKPFHCRAVMTSATLHGSQSYKEVLKPHGVEYTLMVTLSDSPNMFTGLGFLRSINEPPFEQSDVDRLGVLVPHLRRAMAIQNQLSQIDQQIQTSYQVLEALPTGIVIVQQNGYVEFANAAGRNLLGQKDGIEINTAGVISLPKRNANSQFLSALRRVGESGVHDALAPLRPSGRAAFHCLLCRLPGKMGERFPNLFAESRIVIFISDTEQALESSPELLQRLFGLTWAEARLVDRLVAGSSLAEAARQFGIQTSTARSQLKAIFKKTETTSQVDLVRMILSSPLSIVGRVSNDDAYRILQ